MHQPTRPFIHPQLARWARRFLLGGAFASAIGAMVAIADNGVPGDPLGDGLFQWVSPPARYCQDLILATPDDPEAVDTLAGPEEEPEDDEDDWDFLDEPRAAANASGKIMTRCQVHGRCVNNGVETDYTFDWCCFAGKGCYIKTGGAWISLANWLQFGGGACVVQVGCK